jgi:membrane protein DedA with SNARE-associated domain
MPKKTSEGKGIITKEVLIGLLAIIWGGYNLLLTFNVSGIPNIDTSKIQIIGNILLVLAGLLLWLTAYKLWRVKWHTKGLL